MNRVRSQQRQRETYIGPWLPEPWSVGPGSPTSGAPGDPGEAMELADPYAEIASTLDRSEPAVRQLAHRARSRVQVRAPKRPVDSARHREVTAQFLTAAQGGSMEQLLSMLAPDAVLISDGGGKVQAALRPIVGAAKIVRFLAGVMAKDPDGVELTLVTVNGEPGIAGFVNDRLDSLGTLQIDDEVITEVLLVRNPHKLTAVVR